MVKIIRPRRKRWYDDEADWVPPKGRKFVMKGGEEPTSTAPPSNDAGVGGEFQGEAPTDRQGLERAYAQGDTYIWGDTLYIAGSHTARDWYDDVTKVPFWGDLRGAERYQAAEKVLKEHPNVKRVVGHSLGGSVALELQKNHKGLESRTYGAPVWDIFGENKKYGKVERYRNLTDLISIFDGSANNNIKKNPFSSWSFTHGYDNLADNFKAEKSASPPDFSMDEPDDTKMTAMTE